MSDPEVASFVLRWRRGTAVDRAQLRALAVGLVAVIAIIPLTTLPDERYQSLDGRARVPAAAGELRVRHPAARALRPGPAGQPRGDVRAADRAAGRRLPRPGRADHAGARVRVVAVRGARDAGRGGALPAAAARPAEGGGPPLQPGPVRRPHPGRGVRGAAADPGLDRGDRRRPARGGGPDRAAGERAPSGWSAPGPECPRVGVWTGTPVPGVSSVRCCSSGSRW